MLRSITQYLFTLQDSYALTKTLGEIELYRDKMGRIFYITGNSGVIFKTIVNGRTKMLKCYTRPKNNLSEIYGDKLLKEELFIYSDYYREGRWVDVVLDDWIEGRTLQSAIAEACADNDWATIRELAEKFDRLALEMLNRDWAHGDLNTENILLGNDGELRLIDFDSVYLPQFAGDKSSELGTIAFQHPNRKVSDFNRTIDDYSLSLISTALHAIALDTQIYERYRLEEGILFKPAEILEHQSRSLDEVLQLFADHGMAVQYRIAMLLYSSTPTLYGLLQLFDYAVHGVRVECSEPELFVEGGLWGYRTTSTSDNQHSAKPVKREDMVILPLYEAGFDFSDGLAAVEVGNKWHFIDSHGSVRINCHDCDAVKPFKNGVCRVQRGKKWYEIDINGTLVNCIFN